MVDKGHRVVNRRHLKKKTRRGATVVEFALVANIFLMTTFSCFEFCRLNLIRNLTQDAAYYAARKAMVPGATVAEAKAEANRILGFVATKGATIQVNDNDTLNHSSSAISIEVSVPINQNAVITPVFTGDMVFTAVATMRTERFTGFFKPSG